MSFLKAEWRKLILANYKVPEEVLIPYLPHKTELDAWQGASYVSLVGFLFKDTKLMGVKIPLHHTFAEVNLRFYVRYKAEGGWRRGAVFIKELVPRPMISWVANTFYNEHYQTVPLSYDWKEEGKEQVIAYQWRLGGEWHRLAVKADSLPQKVIKGSDVEFITAHYWGYTKINDGKTTAYEVTHPQWEHYPVQAYDIAVDFESNYGEQFAFLNQEKPQSIMLAEGSPITVERKLKI